MDLITDSLEKVSGTIGWLTHLGKTGLKKLSSFEIANHWLLWTHVMDTNLSKASTVKKVLTECYNDSNSEAVVRRAIPLELITGKDLIQELNSMLEMRKTRISSMSEGHPKMLEQSRYMLLSIIRACVKWPAAQSVTNRPRYSMLRQTVAILSKHCVTILDLLEDTEDMLTLCWNSPCIASVVFLTMISKHVGNPDDLLQQIFCCLCAAAEDKTLTYDEVKAESAIMKWKESRERAKDAIAGANISGSETIKNAKSVVTVLNAVSERAKRVGNDRLHAKLKASAELARSAGETMKPEEYLNLVIQKLMRTGDGRWGTQIMLNTRHLIEKIEMATEEERIGADAEEDSE